MPPARRRRPGPTLTTMSPYGDTTRARRRYRPGEGRPYGRAMDHSTPEPAHPSYATSRQGRSLGLPLWAIVGLALISVPRIFAHDLGLDSGPIPAVLTIGPIVIWIAAVLWARVPSPVVTLLVVGAVYGIALGIVHNLLWDEVFGDDPPGLGNLDADLSEVPLRIATAVSSFFTGVMVGLLSGVVATLVRNLSRKAR